MSLLLKAYSLPASFDSVDYAATGLSKPRQGILHKKVAEAPMSGSLFVQGTAAPVINQLLDMGRKTRGIDFVDYVRNTFSDESLSLLEADVVLLYGVGNELSTNTNFSGKVLRHIITHYKKRGTLLVVESPLTASNVMTSYDVTFTNKTVIPETAEASWIS